MWRFLSTVYFCFFLQGAEIIGQSLIPYDLKTLYITNPLGINEIVPKFSWKLKSADSTMTQVSYRILVASHKDSLLVGSADIWDSKIIESNTTNGIPYSGHLLMSSKRYFWTVVVESVNGQTQAAQEISWFETGLLNSDNWEASWISAHSFSKAQPNLAYRPAPYFRKEFSTTTSIKKARLYISGLGYYEAYLNGQRIGDQILDPAVTRYDKTVLYETYDVTDLISEGENVIGVLLGTGWYNFHAKAAWDFDKAPWRDQPVVKAQLEILDSNEEVIKILTDSTWKVKSGPIVFDGIHNGETYDARLEIDGWSEIGLNDHFWDKPYVVEGPAGALKAQIMPPIRHVRTLVPQSVLNPIPGKYVYDFGENIAGRIKLEISGPIGAEVVIRYGERLYDDGTLDQEELSRFVFTGETQTSRVILGPDQPLEWNPVFSYHGFQYAEISLPEDVIVHSITAEVLHTDFETIGTFYCSDTILNRIHNAMKRSYLSNFHGYPTDCPHREKIGWSGDAHLVVEGGLYNFDAITAYLKWLDDFVDEQQPSGQIPGIIPTSGWGYKYGQKEEPYSQRGYGPQWEGAFALILWQLYLHTGDISIIEQYYEPVKNYVLYLANHAEDNLTLSFGIDDHKALIPTGPEILATGYFYSLTQILLKMAIRLDHKNDQTQFTDLSQKIREGYRARFYEVSSRTWGNGSQTSLAGTVYHELCDPSEAEDIIKDLIHDLEENDYHLQTGVVGTKYIINALTRFGYSDVVYRIMTKRTFPSIGFWMEQGATTLWQNWDGSQSRNHVMFGSIEDWFYKTLAGILPDENRPGFEKIIINPSFIEEIDEVEANFNSCQGLIISRWKKSEKTIILDVEIPVNTTGMIILPFGKSKINHIKIGDAKFELNDELIKNIYGVKKFELKSNKILLDVYSGQHHFEIELL